MYMCVNARVQIHKKLTSKSTQKQSLDVLEEETLNFTQLQIGLRCLVFQVPIRLSQVSLIFLPQFFFPGKKKVSVGIWRHCKTLQTVDE